jgi:hypothetical protein
MVARVAARKYTEITLNNILLPAEIKHIIGISIPVTFRGMEFIDHLPLRAIPMAT